MGGPLWRASVENTSVPGGPLALQVRPQTHFTEVTYSDSSNPLVEGQLLTAKWKTDVIAVREVELSPTNASSGGLTGRAVVGRIVPPWTGTRAARLTPLNPGIDVATRLSGFTPKGTECTGPTFGGISTSPAVGGMVHRMVRMRYSWPSAAPLIIWGAGDHDYSKETTVPEPAFLLYMTAGQSTTPATYSGSVVFEEL
jgi:hypothetical protein